MTVTELEVGGRTVRVTNLDKPMWPTFGLTKAHLIDYYVRVAPVLLPHIIGHPVTLHRFPEGISGSHWYQTRVPPHPDWVRTVTMHYPTTGKTFDVAVIDDLPSLVWAVHMGSIELHPYLGRVGALDRPTAMVFDLDPGEPAGLDECCRVARALREVLEGAGLRSVVKASGSIGLHVYVPLNSDCTYAESKTFARAVAGLLVKMHPDLVTDRMPRVHRKGKVFVDWGQNDPGKSTVAPYSMRATVVPRVSIPVGWDEIDDCRVAKIPPGPQVALDRIDAHGDLFQGALEWVQQLPSPHA